MKTLKLVLSLALVAFVFTQCQKDELSDAAPNEKLKSGHVPPEGMFTVTIENVMEHYMFFESGVFNTPVGADMPGPLLPGHSYSATFHASIGHKLSFATMYVHSNDWFYGPADTGIDLFDGLFTGEQEETIDITDRVYLWDAGTEVDNEPMYQPPNPGGTDENGNVMMEIADASDNITITLWYDGIDEFKLTITNKSASSTPLAPGVFVVHKQDYPLYKEGQPDYGNGLEALAEDGDPSMLGHYLKMNSGYVSPLAPGAWVVHNKNKPLFDSWKADYGYGLEALAKDGMPGDLAEWLEMQGYQSGVFGSGPLMPGHSYTFDIHAKAGEYLSFATMLVHTNDLFFSPDERGIRLFHGHEPMTGEITEYIGLWDAGTEVNEYPGAGIHQPARLNGGVDEDGIVMPVDDEFTYPAVDKMIKVTITKN